MSDSADARYQARGVSAGKEEVHAAVADLDAGLFPGAFCRIVPDLLAGDPERCVVMHADDVGTKTSLAYIAWRDGFPVSLWGGIAQDSLVMNLDDCGCVGALGPYLLSNTISRNAKLIPGDVIKAIIDGYANLCARLAEWGIDVRMTGGETSDCGDIIRTIFVDSVVTTAMQRRQVIDASRMAADDVIVGFSCTGQAAWEDAPNAGMGSNGLTAARHEALCSAYRQRYPESFSPEIDPALAYSGPHRLSDPLPGDDRFTVGSALLSPTRTYLPLIKQIVEQIPVSDIHGLVHCTGGGQTKIGKFGGPGLRYVKDAPFATPPLFRMLQAATNLPWRETYAVFNMGHRLEAVLPKRHVPVLLDIARACQIEAQVVGRVEADTGATNTVVIQGEGGEHVYAVQPA